MVRVKEGQGLFLIFAVVTLFSLCLVFANPLIYFSSGVANLSVNEDVYNVMNFSVNNTDTGGNANITEINMTIPISFILNDSSNGSSKAHNFTNSSTVLSWSGDNITGIASAKEYFSFNFTAPIIGDFVLNISAKNQSYIHNTSITITINDTNGSDVSFGTLTLANSSSVSQTFIYVNTSVTQLHENAVVFELHNLTGGLINRSVRVAGIRVINWTAGLGNGSYIYNVTVNDTFGNFNTTGNIIYIDSVAPNVTASCDSTTYVTGESIYCTCSIADNVDSSPNWTQSTYSTDEPGTFTYSCTASDNVPYSTSSSFTYTVSYSASTPSSGGATITKTYIVGDEDFKTGFTKQIAKNERIRFSVNGGTHSVIVNELTSSTVKINVASETQTATLQIGDLRKFDVTGDGYYDLSVKLNSITGSKADLTMISIHELLTEESEVEEQEKEGVAGDIEGDLEEKGFMEGIWLWVLIGVVVVLVLVGAGYKLKKVGKI